MMNTIQTYDVVGIAVPLWGCQTPCRSRSSRNRSYSRDQVSLRRVLNTPKRGIGDRAEAIHAAVTMMGEGDVASEFTLHVERGSTARVLEATQALPRVVGAFSKASMLRNMEEISARNVLIMSSILTAFAAVIAVGVVYNNARIALAERAWDLASLRRHLFTTRAAPLPRALRQAARSDREARAGRAAAVFY